MLQVGVKVSMHDLFCDVIEYCATLGCNCHGPAVTHVIGALQMQYMENRN